LNRLARAGDQYRIDAERVHPVRAVSVLKLLLAAISLCVGFSAAASAQDEGPPQQIAPATPPALPQNPLPGTPAPAVAPQAAASSLPADLQACLQETGDYVTRGRTVFYIIAITNSCAARLRCEVFANVTGVRGTSLGHTVMVLGPAGSAAAKKSYDMRVKAAGGIAQVSRECKVL
jgi:hypothetical protein